MKTNKKISRKLLTVLPLLLFLLIILCIILMGLVLVLFENPIIMTILKIITCVCGAGICILLFIYDKQYPRPTMITPQSVKDSRSIVEERDEGYHGKFR